MMGISQSLFCQPSTCHICEGFSKHFPNRAHHLVLRSTLFRGFYCHDGGGSGAHLCHLIPPAQALFPSYMTSVECQCFHLIFPEFFLQLLLLCVMRCLQAKMVSGLYSASLIDVLCNFSYLDFFLF